MNLVQYIVHLAVIIVHKNSSIHGQGYHFDVRPFCWTGLTYFDSGLRHSAGRAATRLSCGVRFEALAYTQASTGVCMPVSIVVAAKPW